METSLSPTGQCRLLVGFVPQLVLTGAAAERRARPFSHAKSRRQPVRNSSQKPVIASHTAAKPNSQITG